MLRPLSWTLLIALLLAGVVPAHAQLATTETEGVRFVYLPGTQDYLVPHAARTFLNALAFHKKLFGFEPSEEITVLMLDLEDSGNASATSVPRDILTVQIAPLNFAFETIAGNDRMNIIMNHELLHVVSMDQATRQDRTFRRLFGGKVAPVPAQPESILYFFMTVPRVAAPRWYHEGTAIVLRYLDGRRPRARAERVRRDGVPFDGEGRQPILRPAGPGVGGHEDRLSARRSTRISTARASWCGWPATTDRAGWWSGLAAAKAAAPTTPAQFRAVFGTTIEAAWARWITVRSGVPDEEPGGDPDARRHDPPRISPRARSAPCHGRTTTTARRPCTPRVNYPGVVSHVGAISTETGEVTRLANVKGPTVFTVTSLALDPERGTLFYTTDNGAWRDLVSLDPSSRKRHAPAEGRTHR